MSLINLTTSSGIATIRVEDISAYCSSEESQGILKPNIYNVDVHMVSGTIFTSRMSEAQHFEFEDMMQDSFVHYERRKEVR
tara:strand:- start:1886 stop:2128 length:243 start_codon:yes stop_codon:yes gene_type:complete